jgi:ArsR family transcriptional regulator
MGFSEIGGAMPAPESELILAPERTRVRISAEPVANTLNSLFLLSQIHQLSGLDEWITQTAQAMSPELYERHRVIFQGLYFALSHDGTSETFEQYIDRLEKRDPKALRNRVLEAYLTLEPCDDRPDPGITQVEEILTSEQAFIDFLYIKFDPEKIDEPIERQSYRLLTHPNEMKQAIVEHLQTMWADFLQTEWLRTQPLVEESVEMLSEIDLGGKTDAEIAQLITGKEREDWDRHFEAPRELTFVPSPHAGPYVNFLKNENQLWVLFGLRVPEGSTGGSLDLSNAELLVRLEALADTTRLKILETVRANGEVCSQELIDILDLSQSSVSRHLRQLTASGYLIERRTESGKCYSINADRLKDTAASLERIFE